MKNNKKFIILLLIIIFIICFEIFRNNGVFLKRNINQDTGLIVDKCKAIEINFPEASFNGDGELFAKFNCNLNSKDFDNLEGWNKLPILENLNITTEKFYQLSKINRGFYYINNIKEKNSSSTNLLLLIYDIDSNILYYYDYNT